MVKEMFQIEDNGRFLFHLEDRVDKRGCCFRWRKEGSENREQTGWCCFQSLDR